MSLTNPKYPNLKQRIRSWNFYCKSKGKSKKEEKSCSDKLKNKDKNYKRKEKQGKNRKNSFLKWGRTSFDKRATSNKSIKNKSKWNKKEKTSGNNSKRNGKVNSLFILKSKKSLKKRHCKKRRRLEIWSSLKKNRYISLITYQTSKNTKSGF